MRTHRDAGAIARSNATAEHLAQTRPPAAAAGAPALFVDTETAIGAAETNDVIASTASPTNGVTALKGDGATLSHSTGARGVVSNQRRRRGEVAAETERVSP